MCPSPKKQPRLSKNLSVDEKLEIIRARFKEKKFLSFFVVRYAGNKVGQDARKKTTAAINKFIEFVDERVTCKFTFF